MANLTNTQAGIEMLFSYVSNSISLNFRDNQTNISLALFRTRQVRTDWDRSGKVRKGQDRSGKVRTGQDGSGRVRTGQDM